MYYVYSGHKDSVFSCNQQIFCDSYGMVFHFCRKFGISAASGEGKKLPAGEAFLVYLFITIA